MSRKKIEIPREPVEIARMRERHSHVLTDATKVEQVKALSLTYQDLVRQVAHTYWAAQYLPLVLGYPHWVITQRRQDGEDKKCLLPSHYQAQAVLDGLDVIRGSWKQTFAAVRSKVAKRFPDTTETTDDENGLPQTKVVQNSIRHEINWFLCWPELLGRIMAGEIVLPLDEEGKQRPEFAANDHPMICHWLNRALHQRRSGQPQISKRLSFEAESGMIRIYKTPSVPEKRLPGQGDIKRRHFEVFVSLQGMTPRARIKIPMAGSVLSVLDQPGNVLISVEPDSHGRERIVFRKAIKTQITPRAGTETVGLDKGVGIAIAATNSYAEQAKHFGPESGVVLLKRTGKQYRRQRSRFASQADRLSGRWTPSGRFHGNPNPTRSQRNKARNIRRNNLGSGRKNTELRRARAEVANVNGRAARELVEAYPEAGTFHEEKLNFISTNKQHKEKGVNRFLNNWAKRDLSKKLGLHISASGARRQFVNAAYTSQECPGCHWTDRGNRSGISFVCSHCGYTGHVDSVASSNIRSRGSDGDITLFTPVKRVKEILLARHATTDARCASRGPGHQPLPEVPGSGQIIDSDLF
jgi:putative transposase